MSTPKKKLESVLEAGYEFEILQLLCNPKFRSELNQLREMRVAWVGGPPMAYSVIHGESEEDAWLEEGVISRNDVQRPAQVDQREDVFIAAWECLENKWGVRLPKDALTEVIPDLSALTINEWVNFGLSMGIIPPVVSSVQVDLSHDLQGAVIVRPTMGYPAGALTEMVTQKISLAITTDRIKTGGSTRLRNHHRKLPGLLKVFRLALEGWSDAEIAKLEGKPITTVKSQVKAASKLLGATLVRGKGWKDMHKEMCSICKSIGVLSYQRCPIAKNRLEMLRTSEKRKSCPAPTPKEFEPWRLPPRTVCSEKSAFAKYEANIRR